MIQIENERKNLGLQERKDYGFCMNRRKEALTIYD
jgi:hypothetical protein